MIDLEATDELQINTVMQQATQQIPKNPNQPATTAKIQVTIETSAVNSNEKKTKPKTTRIVPPISTILIVVRQIRTPTIKIRTIPMQTIHLIEKTRNPDLCTHPVRPVVKQSIPQRNILFGANAANRPLPRMHRIRSINDMPKTIQIGLFTLQPEL